MERRIFHFLPVEKLSCVDMVRKLVSCHIISIHTPNLGKQTNIHSKKLLTSRNRRLILHFDLTLQFWGHSRWTTFDNWE